jgi:hypothetical protein
MVKVCEFDEIIRDMMKVHSDILNREIKIGKAKIFFIDEQSGRRIIENEFTKLFFIKTRLLNYQQFNLQYNHYCNEKRTWLNLVLITNREPYIIGYEVSEKKDNPYGLVNVAFSNAIPDGQYEVFFI